MAFKQLTPNDWMLELERGLEYRRLFGLEHHWTELEAIFYNVHESMASEGPNILLSMADSILSSLVVANPRVKISPTRPESVQTAPILEALDNILLQELEIADRIATASLHAYIWGVGILKIGYDSEYGFDPRFDVGGNLNLGMTMTQFSPQADRRIEYGSDIQPGMPWIRPVLPHDFIVPYGTSRTYNSPWVANRIVRHIDDLKADKKYKNTRNLTPNLTLEDVTNSYLGPANMHGRFRSPTSGMRDTEFVEFYEIHDRRTRRIYCVVPGYDKFIRDTENHLQIEGRLPFVDVHFTPRARTFWTTPDAYYLLSSQLELADISRQRTKQRRATTLKFLYNEDVINEHEFNKLMSPDVGIGAKVSGGVDLRQAVTTMNNAPNDALMLEEEHIRRNIREQLGLSRNQLGEFAGARTTAREVEAVSQAAQLRLGRRGKIFSKAFEETVETVNSMIFSFWNTRRWIQVIGENQKQQWVTFSGSELADRYTYNVELSDEQGLRHRALEALQLYGTLVNDPTINHQALREFLSSAFNMPEFGRIFDADPSVQMQQMQQQEGSVLQEGGDPGRGNTPLLQ